MGWIEIVCEIIKILIAYGLGMFVTEWLLDNEANEAFDTGYEIGYAKGKEEENLRIMEQLEEYRKGETL